MTIARIIGIYLISHILSADVINSIKNICKNYTLKTLV
jgi:hypothetical protein